jgi:hypothetical protein
MKTRQTFFIHLLLSALSAGCILVSFIRSSIKRKQVNPASFTIYSFASSTASKIEHHIYISGMLRFKTSLDTEGIFILDNKKIKENLIIQFETILVSQYVWVHWIGSRIGYLKFGHTILVNPTKHHTSWSGIGPTHFCFFLLFPFSVYSFSFIFVCLFFLSVFFFVSFSLFIIWNHFTFKNCSNLKYLDLKML